MKIEMTTSADKVMNEIAKQMKRREQVLVRQLLYCAEQITNAARDTRSYQDQTGNLRSSLGCIVAIDGKVVNEVGFQQTLNGSEGVKNGKEYIRKILAEQFPKGIVLVAVAGMNYAGYVSARGYDVLDSAELLAEKLVPQYLKQLGFR